ncbi:MAG: oligosaccharide flippase family protein [Aggregatilineales bacterium]
MRRYTPDFALIVLLFILPLILFSQQTLGGRTLLPTENLYQYEPYATYREVVNAPDVPHNHLLSDLVLQNMQWKSFIRESIDQREVPLWNPHQFSGIPFMAAGQQSTLYPLSLIYYVMPLTAAYGWFTVFNLWLAGMFMLMLMRGLGVGRFGGMVAAVTYQLCGFFIASAVFPMILGAAVWMPLILLMIEFIIQQKPLFGRPSSLPWMIVGAVAVACNIFAGHVELTIYSLLIAGFYGGARLLWNIWQNRTPYTPHLKAAGWMLAMVLLGFSLGALQFIPLFQVANDNWRSERADLSEVLGYAHAPRDVLQFVMPNFYGSPADHSYFDIFTLEETPVTVNMAGEPITHTEWGIKNYVEGALYLGILPLILAIFALFMPAPINTDPTKPPPFKWIFALLTLISLTFMFGLPTYAAIYFLPGINQLNSPFRWVYGVTLGVAILAGFGAHALTVLDINGRKWARRFGYGLIALALLIFAGLLVSRLIFPQIESTISNALSSLAGQGGEVAADRFSGAQMFFSYQFVNALIFGVMLLASGIIFWFFGRTLNEEGDLTGRPYKGRPHTSHRLVGAGKGSLETDVAPPRPLWERGLGGEGAIIAVQIFAIALIAVDLIIASAEFNPASDPNLLDFTPPAVEWLLERQAEEGAFRYTTIDAPAQGLDNMLQPNMTMRYGLADIRGYDSIISSQYVEYMRSIQIQPQLDFNRVAPLYLDRIEADEVNWSRLNLLNVRYIVTHNEITLAENLTTTSDPRRFAPPLELVYADEAVNIYRNNGAYPRAALTEPLDGQIPGFETQFVTGMQATITRDTGRERFVDVDINGVATHWLLISETYADGWRAYIRPQGASDDYEKPLDVVRVFETLQGIEIAPNALAERYGEGDVGEAEQTAIIDGRYTLRVVYSPTSFQVGLFGTLISGALIVFMAGVWLWRLWIVPDSGEGSTTSRIARNSLAPIILNLFNRGIDFVFAFVMLRILGPEDAGIYYYAVIVFVWFDIFTNFGLDVFLIRETSRNRDSGGFFFFNTTFLRLGLMVACVPLLLGFLLVRQSIIDPALNQEALLAIGLLYIGLAPGSLSKGLTSLFYAFERAEYPAAVATVTTINKAVLGLIVLLLGYGIIGLAGVSIVVNLVTLGILYVGARQFINPRRGDLLGSSEPGSPSDDAPPRPLWERGLGGEGKTNIKPDTKLIRGMVNQSYPLMLNHFLATIFFQIDVVILEAMRGAVIVGKYSVAYRWLLALNVIPAFFTQALLPVMSRQANEDRVALRRTYTLGIKLMVALAFPLAVAFTFLAQPLTLLLGGNQFLPEGAIALQIMIWSIPLGWINSLTQYLLIAVDLQRRITRAFAVAVTFNIVTNLIFIPRFGYQAAAITTILSELVLLIPFAILTHGALNGVRWLDLIWRQAVAAGVMFAVMLVGWSSVPVLALIIGSTLYPVILLALRPFNADELARLTPLIPTRFKWLVGN